jgi:hypothetical protein
MTGRWVSCGRIRGSAVGRGTGTWGRAAHAGPTIESPCEPGDVSDRGVPASVRCETAGVRGSGQQGRGNRKGARH